MGKKILLMLLSLVVIFLTVVDVCRAAEEILFSDDFDSYDIKKWGPQPAKGVTVQEGKLIVDNPKPSTGIAFITSTKNFQFVTFETKVKFNKFSSDSTIFYYLGFQSIAPWGYNVCWITIQDTRCFASTTKDRGKLIRERAVDLEQNRWYNIKIVWASDRIEFFFDGESVYKTQDTEVMPEVGMPVFLGAYTLDTAKEPADMEIEWVTIKGEPKK
ncbi:MAG: DUF1080 domain-containing protein [Planctomycetes bacterium]|nr:DUF1080 domain-containing protein [Planctomycetota bacterium]